jgi:FMN phosphatase YigB (HAD superfamily)/DNA-binding XRE family transcriptional regulator
MSEKGGEKALGLKLQKARQAAGLTQQELCQKSGLSYSTLAKIERGAIKSPSIFTIQQIAGVLGTSVDELLGDPIKPKQAAKKVSKNGISFVYFDINGFLVGFFHRAFTKIAVELDLPLDQVESTCWHYNDAVCRGDITLVQYNQALAKEFGVESFDWSSYYLSSVDPIMEAQELVTWAQQHYRIGLLSNIMPGLIQSMRDSGLIPNLPYDVIIDSSDVKAIKPEATIFEIATKKAGVKPEQILFIDDSRANLMAAEKLGWRVTWFDDFRPKESADRIYKSLEF